MGEPKTESKLRLVPPFRGDRHTIDLDLVEHALKAARGEEAVETCSACAKRAPIMFDKCGFCLTGSFR